MPEIDFYVSQSFSLISPLVPKINAKAKTKK